MPKKLRFRSLRLIIYKYQIFLGNITLKKEMKGVVGLCGILILIKIGRVENDIIVSNGRNDQKKIQMRDNNTEPFIATNEWQVIKPGQATFAGLHIRVNFETGEKEAKLLERERSEEINHLSQNKQNVYFTEQGVRKSLRALRYNARGIDAWPSNLKLLMERKIVDIEVKKNTDVDVDELTRYLAITGVIMVWGVLLFILFIKKSLFRFCRNMFT